MDDEDDNIGSLGVHQVLNRITGAHVKRTSGNRSAHIGTGAHKHGVSYKLDAWEYPPGLAFHTRHQRMLVSNMAIYTDTSI